MSSRGQPLRYLARNKSLTNDARASVFLSLFFERREKNNSIDYFHSAQLDYYREVNLHC